MTASKYGNLLSHPEIHHSRRGPQLPAYKRQTATCLSSPAVELTELPARAKGEMEDVFGGRTYTRGGRNRKPLLPIENKNAVLTGKQDTGKKNVPNKKLQPKRKPKITAATKQKRQKAEIVQINMEEPTLPINDDKSRAVAGEATIVEDKGHNTSNVEDSRGNNSSIEVRRGAEVISDTVETGNDVYTSGTSYTKYTTGSQLTGLTTATGSQLTGMTTATGFTTGSQLTGMSTATGFTTGSQLTGMSTATGFTSGSQITGMSTATGFTTGSQITGMSTATGFTSGSQITGMSTATGFTTGSQITGQTTDLQLRSCHGPVAKATLIRKTPHSCLPQGLWKLRISYQPYLPLRGHQKSYNATAEVVDKIQDVANEKPVHTSTPNKGATSRDKQDYFNQFDLSSVKLDYEEDDLLHFNTSGHSVNSEEIVPLSRTYIDEQEAFDEVQFDKITLLAEKLTNLSTKSKGNSKQAHISTNEILGIPISSQSVNITTKVNPKLTQKQRKPERKVSTRAVAIVKPQAKKTKHQLQREYAHYIRPKSIGVQRKRDNLVL
ncbi:hypothetical protein MAR_001496 [Mya arenaria]|uniref:Uncharacterized protein n=1 Tax=Mya arenaria TaxID=6604 RepID=A0ABY7FG13_MYAAR|nr:hypothetical protein MAR_001496 [Mya arenaria]